MGPFSCLTCSNDLGELDDVVAVDGAEIREAHLLEQHAGEKKHLARAWRRAGWTAPQNWKRARNFLTLCSAPRTAPQGQQLGQKRAEARRRGWR